MKSDTQVDARVGSSNADLRDGISAIVPGVGKDCEFAGQPHGAYCSEATLIALPKDTFATQETTDMSR